MIDWLRNTGGEVMRRLVAFAAIVLALVVGSGLFLHAHRVFHAYTTVYWKNGVLVEHQRFAGTLRIRYDVTDEKGLKQQHVVQVPDYYDSDIVRDVEKHSCGLVVSFVGGRTVFVVGDRYNFDGLDFAIIDNSQEEKEKKVK